jgi:hypothetical protein
MPPSCSPSLVAVFVSFVVIHLIRGVTNRMIVYFLVGALIVDDGWYHWLPGGLVMLIGAAYVVLEFVPSIEPPANMRDADAGWGQEQV